ncbi:MAG TPA: hypothetical protein ENH85_02940 [Candidatus Scalindua sp.]|nr:hypothetical protein [Candidatus Scalindua sp.]
MKKERFKIKCVFCENKFESIKSRLIKAKYCSAKCFFAWRKNNPWWRECLRVVHKKVEDTSNYRGGNSKGKTWKIKDTSKYSKAKKGKKHPHWILDRSLFLYPDEFNNELKEQIRKRDNYTCQLSGKHQNELTGRFKKLDVHHIDYNKKNNDPKNLISLSRDSHSKTNFNRKYWTNYFSNFLLERLKYIN